MQGTVDIPLEMRDVGGEIYVDGRQFKGSPRLERVHRLYFRSALVLWQFAYYAYRISDLMDDYTNIPLDEVLFKHFIPSYVGTALFTENGMQHTHRQTLKLCMYATTMQTPQLDTIYTEADAERDRQRQRERERQRDRETEAERERERKMQLFIETNRWRQSMYKLGVSTKAEYFRYICVYLCSMWCAGVSIQL